MNRKELLKTFIKKHFGLYGLNKQCGDWHQTSETDVSRRQILTSEVGPRAERFKLSGLYFYLLIITNENVLIAHCA